ncbi:N-6 DNA methylase [Rathayibacter sp. AY1B5]|uniref:N-6 DNA methylase n=1 Tax=Rathayibacter sp. AY1B5 TaxID=2080530 RepID=UPI000CE82F21|nr:N-6 DNA methylase [Rathayibacter sp. AY1B5]PPI25966.1 hypothetical protein C5D44_10400 [Rathayibacter sp. AY1B5]
MTTATTTVLNTDQRRFLDTQTQRARDAAQRAAEDALRALAVSEPSRPAYLSDEHNKLRLTLRDKARQLGDDTTRAGASLTHLIHDVAYEQWHRLLFARFLEVNGLLRHPEYRDISLSLEDCGDFASEFDEPDAWAVAARFASEILPGVFRLTNPAVQVRFAAEHRNALERLLLEIPADVFATEDALGWVYQFWQTAEKKRVNDLGVKIGGPDLSPVTQLFTENYMVRFLLENSLGAWWAVRHPESPLVASWGYLRRNEDGTPAAGSFLDWPDRAADVTVIDPCCGSGHFLVAMFGMLWRMRAEEEDLTPTEAQDAVLRDNLHGLELDPRCTQLATFNVALEAWKQGGFRELPAPQIACSGVPVRGGLADWEAYAGSDDELRASLSRLHSLFSNADTLGSLIDVRATPRDASLFGRDMSIAIDWAATRRALNAALQREHIDQTVLGHTAEDVAHASLLLSRTYTLVATNPPFLHRSKQAEAVRSFLDFAYPRTSQDLSTAFIDRAISFTENGGSIAVVSPQNWLQLGRYREMRRAYLQDGRVGLVTLLGGGAFSGISGEVVKVALSVLHSSSQDVAVTFVDSPESSTDKAAALKSGPLVRLTSAELLEHEDALIVLRSGRGLPLLSTLASALGGITTGDSFRYRRNFWELPELSNKWALQQAPPASTSLYAGRERVLLWEDGNGALRDAAILEGATIAGQLAWGQPGVAVGKTGALPCTIYTGEIYENVCAVIIPKKREHLPAVWAFCSSPDFAKSVREVDSSLGVTANTLAKVPFDLDYWQSVSDAMSALAEPASSDPTQWIFEGSPPNSLNPLQVGVARLLGYRWPRQVDDHLNRYADSDGIAALVPLPGEPDLATRLRELLSAGFGSDWSSVLERKIVIEAGGKNGKLEDWLRDQFFAQHVRVFDSRPFLWQIWDGRKDGFSAIVNYHKLNRRTLEKLTFTSLGAWIDRQKHEARAERAGADARLAAAEELQRRLQLILEGAPPYDIYVRWKSMAEQPIGWEPDLVDGVRLNIRPFVHADALRSRVNVHWRKDRGANPDGSERHNDLHPTLEERRAARHGVEVAG